MPDVEGSVAAGFEPVRTAFRRTAFRRNLAGDPRAQTRLDALRSCL